MKAKERDKAPYLALLLMALVIRCSKGSLIPPTRSGHSLTQHAINSADVKNGNFDINTLKEDKMSEIPVAVNAPEFTTNCTKGGLSIMGKFAENFKGRIYAKDYSDEATCGVTMSNHPSKNVNFRIPLGECGIQMKASDNAVNFELLYEVQLYIQYSAYLQQMMDETVAVFCLQAIPPETEKSEAKLNVSTRQGRRMKGTSVKKSRTKVGNAIMEIINGKEPSPKSKQSQAVAVGEDVTLVVTTKISRGFDARIVNCTTHDGSRLSNSDSIRNQPILDSLGCSVDRGLVPNFRRRRLPIESQNRIITLHFASFPAFKFPDRDHLHIQCTVAYCKGPCPQEACDGSNHYGTWREKYGRIADVLIETGQVVNSIEVLSPDLDLAGGYHYEKHQSSSSFGADSSGISDRTGRLSSNKSSAQRRPSHSTHYSKSPPTYFQPVDEKDRHQYQFKLSGADHLLWQNNVCISPETIIIALVVLGLILVISITATLWFALKRSEVKKYAESQRSIYSSPAPAPYYRFSHW